MTGKGHRWTGVGAAFFAAAFAHLLQLPEIVAAAVAGGSCTLPDWLELPYYRNGVRSGSIIKHRTITHWPPLWLAVIAYGAHLGGIEGAICLGAAIGALTHILGDAPNPMGIPWLIPNRRLRIGQKGLWRSGEHEFLLVLLFGTSGFVTWRIVTTPAGVIAWLG